MAFASLSAPAGSLTLFHCHIQAHMDYGFKALFRYG
jgi:FtsP/CotA-like multicopper oxidase with cupredoxin domain